MNPKRDHKPRTHLALEFKVMYDYTYIYYDYKIPTMSLDFWQ